MEVTRCSSMHELRLNFQDCVEYAAKASSIKKIAPMIFRPKEKVGSKRAKRSRQDSHSSSIVESLKSGRNEVRPLSRISGIIVTCLASWKENGWVFLVAKRVDKPVKPGLSCMVGNIKLTRSSVDICKQKNNTHSFIDTQANQVTTRTGFMR